MSADFIREIGLIYFVAIFCVGLKCIVASIFDQQLKYRQPHQQQLFISFVNWSRKTLCPFCSQQRYLFTHSTCLWRVTASRSIGNGGRIAAGSAAAHWKIQKGQ